MDPEKKREGEEDKAERKRMDRASRGEEEIKSRGVGSTTLVGRPELELGAVNRNLSWGQSTVDSVLRLQAELPDQILAWTGVEKHIAE